MLPEIVKIQKKALTLVVGLVSILPFCRSLNYGVVQIDDYTYVVEHKEIYGGFPEANFKWMLQNNEHAIFMPLTWLSYLTDCEIARHLIAPDASLDEKEAARFRIMHLHSVLLHGINSALVFAFLLILISAGSKQGVIVAFLVSLFWGVHPLRVESVVWIASRKDLVSFFWLTLAMISWIHWRHRQGNDAARLTIHYWMSLVFVVVGAMAKPSVMVFPGLILLIDLFMLRKLELRRDSRWQFKNLIVYVLPIIIGMGISIEATVYQNGGGAMSNPIPVWYRLLNAPVSYGVYLKNTVWPLDLALQCVLQYPRSPHFFLPGMIIFGFCAFCLVKSLIGFVRCGFAVREGDFILSGALWFFLSLVPFIGLVGFGYHAYADRFTYIPAVGLSLLMAGVLQKAEKPILLRIILVCAILLLLPLTWRQVGYWRGEESIWKRTLAVDGERNTMANVCLGMYEYDVPHNLDLAMQYFDKAYETDRLCTTQYGLIYMNILSEMGKSEKAFEFYKFFRDWNELRNTKNDIDFPGSKKVLLGPDYATARVSMLLMETNSLSSAEQELNDLLKIFPKSPHVLYLKGRLAERRGDYVAAQKAWNETLNRVEPDSIFVRYRFLKNIVMKEDRKNGLE